jgi:hypothetical protein
VGRATYDSGLTMEGGGGGGEWEEGGGCEEGREGGAFFESPGERDSSVCSFSCSEASDRDSSESL